MQQLDIQTIYRLLFSKIRMLMIFTVIGAVSLGCIAQFLMPERYSTGVSVYVSNLADVADSKQPISYSNLNSAEWLVKTYKEILQNQVTLNKVVPRLSRQISPQTLAGMIRVEGIEDTAIMRITVTADDPVFAAEICNAIAEVAPQVLTDVVGAGSVTAVGKARRGGRTQPNVPRMTVLGALAGLVLAAGIVIVQYLLDNTVKTEAALKERLNVPVLGVIPAFDHAAKGGKKHG